MGAESRTVDRPSLVESVHLWTMHLSASASTTEILTSYLDQAERARAARIQVSDGWRRFVLGRGALRLILGRYLKRRPQDVVFTYGVHGKPSLTRSDLRFNYSASADVAVMAVCIGTDLGIDIEEVRAVNQPLDIASRYCHAREVRELAATGDAERDAAFLRLWTCKEAVVKALGLGLSTPLDSFCLADFSSGNARVVHRPDMDGGSEWELCVRSSSGDYVTALAYQGPRREIVREHVPTLDDLNPEP
jgi:4'-phosphopantetheinyl transferase